MSLMDNWVKDEQAKHRLCGCGCGSEITIQKWHHTRGIPKYIHGHGNKKLSDWVESQQGLHFCQCGCELYDYT